MPESVKNKYNSDIGYSRHGAKREKFKLNNIKDNILAADLIGRFGLNLNLNDLVRGGMISESQYRVLYRKEHHLGGAYSKSMPKAYLKFLKEYGVTGDNDRIDSHLYTREEQEAFELSDLTDGMIQYASVQNRRDAKNPVSRLMNHLGKNGYTYNGAKKRILHTALKLRRRNLILEKYLKHQLRYGHPRAMKSNELTSSIQQPGLKQFPKGYKKFQQQNVREHDKDYRKHIRNRLAKLHHGDEFLSDCFRYFDIDPKKYHDYYPEYPKVDKKYNNEMKKAKNPFLYNTVARMSLNLQRRDGQSPLQSVRYLKNLADAHNLGDTYKTSLKEFKRNRLNERELQRNRDKQLRDKFSQKEQKDHSSSRYHSHSRYNSHDKKRYNKQRRNRNAQNEDEGPGM